MQQIKGREVQKPLNIIIIFVYHIFLTIMNNFFLLYHKILMYEKRLLNI